MSEESDPSFAPTESSGEEEEEEEEEEPASVKRPRHAVLVSSDDERPPAPAERRSGGAVRRAPLSLPQPPAPQPSESESDERRWEQQQQRRRERRRVSKQEFYQHRRRATAGLVLAALSGESGSLSADRDFVADDEEPPVKARRRSRVLASSSDDARAPLVAEEEEEEEEVAPSARRGGSRRQVLRDSDDEGVAAVAKAHDARLKSVAEPEDAPAASPVTGRSAGRVRASAGRQRAQAALARLASVRRQSGPTGGAVVRMEQALRAAAAESGSASDGSASPSSSSDADDAFVVAEDEEAPAAVEEEEDVRVACVCGSVEEDGKLMVQCSNRVCAVWAHAECVGFSPLDEAALWFCKRCAPAAAAFMDEGVPLEGGFAPVAAPSEDLPPSEAKARAWRRLHGTREVGAALTAVLSADRPLALLAILEHSRPGAVQAETKRSGALLLRAVSSGAVRCLRALLRAPGLDPRMVGSPIAALCSALHFGSVDAATAIQQEVPTVWGLAQQRGAFEAGGAALQAAAAGGDGACFTLALGSLSQVQRAASLTAADDEGCTCAMLAAGAEGGALEIVLQALGERASAEVRRVDNSGACAMHFAASAGIVAHIMALSRVAPSTLHSRDSGGATPLHLAAGEGRVDAVAALLSLGAQVTANDADGWPPLLYASGAAVLALLRCQPEVQLASLTTAWKTPQGEARAGALMRELAEDPGAFAILNSYLRGCISMLAGPMSFLLRRPSVLDAANKRRWLSHLAAGLRSRLLTESYDDDGDECSLLRVSRARAFSDWAALGPQHDSRALWRPIWRRLRIIDSPLSLGSGVEREWLELCAAELASADCGLLAPTAEGGRALAPVPGAGRLEAYTALGCLLGYCLVHERTLPLYMETAFLRGLLGRANSLSLSDLESVDPVFARSLRMVRDAPDVEKLELTWSADDGGSDQPITEENKAAFVDAAAAWRLHGRVAGAVAAVRAGLLCVIPADWLRVLTEADLGLFVAGVPELDIADWRRNTSLEGFQADSPAVVWFWSAVGAMSAEDRGLLMRFATGSSAAPLGGFANLVGLHGLHPFTLQLNRSAPVDRLPTAATCFNTLSLPDYPSSDVLRRKLLSAIRNGAGGFEFGAHQIECSVASCMCARVRLTHLARAV